MTARPEQILNYWFGEAPLAPRGRLWWSGGPNVDEDIRDRFLDNVEVALVGHLDHWADEPETALALVLLLDQFTRNIFRGTERAFSGDHRALNVTLAGIARGFDDRLHPLQASFFYMPLEHAESMQRQDQCVERFEHLLERSAPEYHDYLSGNLDYARDHRTVIERFGRFPHRNRVLDRTSTPEEVAYLDGGGKRYGQG